MLISGLLLGTVSGICNGATNVAVAVVGRRVGSVRALIGLLACSLAWFALVGLVTGVPIPREGSFALAAATVAAVSTGTSLAFFVGLRLGPVAVVGPIAGCYGVVVVMFAVVMLGEPLGLVQALAVAAATIGVVLATVSFEGLRGTPRLVSPGVLFGLVTVVGYAATVIGLGQLTKDYGWLPATIAWRFFGTCLAVSFLAVSVVLERRRPSGHEPDSGSGHAEARSAMGLIVLAGSLDALATLTLVVGLGVSYAWLVGLLNSLGPMSGAIAGVVLFGERLTRAQVVGLVLVAVSLVGLAIG
jgi:drug/metabolite transporter (DMT)-like permease